MACNLELPAHFNDDILIVSLCKFSDADQHCVYENLVNETFNDSVHPSSRVKVVFAECPDSITRARLKRLNLEGPETPLGIRSITCSLICYFLRLLQRAVQDRGPCSLVRLETVPRG